MSEYDDIRLIALASVLTDSSEYGLRHIFRWYSTTFCTPLHIVEDLPLVEVLQHWHESEYEKLLDDDEGRLALKDLIESYLLSDEDKAKKASIAEAEEAELLQFGSKFKDASLKPTTQGLPSEDAKRLKDIEFVEFDTPPPPNINVSWKVTEDPIDEDRGLFDEFSGPKTKQS